MSHILLIRHAETDLRGTFCGQTDPPLNENGRQQLQGLIDALRSYDIAAVHTSDLQRAQATAQAIARAYVTTVRTHPALREIHFGTWEALTWAQVEECDYAFAQRWMDAYPHLATPEGEPFEAFRTRVLKAFAEIAARPSEGDIAVVTHAGVIQLLLTELCGRTPQQAYEQTRAYCSVVRFESAHEVQHG